MHDTHIFADITSNVIFTPCEPPCNFPFTAGCHLYTRSGRNDERDPIMKEANSEVVIKASAERVWSILSTFDKYPEWNPFLLSIAGNLREGEPLSVKVKMKDKTNLFKVRVTRVSAGREFCWQAGLKGLLSSEHYFRVRKINESKVSFKQGEKFWGIFSFLIGNGLLEQAASTFDRMNDALKQRAEAGVQPT